MVRNRSWPAVSLGMINTTFVKHITSPSISLPLCGTSGIIYHICNFIFFPSSSIVLILKSIPEKTKAVQLLADFTQDGIHHGASGINRMSQRRKA